MGDSELQCVVTAVVGASDAAAARQACSDVAARLHGEIADAADCSAEDPGCWAVTIRAASAVPSGVRSPDATLSAGVRRMLRALGVSSTRGLVHCAPPAAWAVLEDPELLTGLIPHAERLLLEARADNADTTGDAAHDR